MRRWRTAVTMGWLALVLQPTWLDSAPRSVSVVPAESLDRCNRQTMNRWIGLYRQELRPVRKEWSRVVRAIQRGRPADLVRVCPAFRERVAGVDHDRLEAVPDPVIRVWLGRGLVLLDDAARQCRRERFFALGYRLELAREAIQLIDRRLKRYP